ncbi:hypothetical protein PTTG_09756, partial [Puccinia triticina 1-1 BBBD Race 1]
MSNPTLSRTSPSAPPAFPHIIVPDSTPDLQHLTSHTLCLAPNSQSLATASTPVPPAGGTRFGCRGSPANAPLLPVHECSPPQSSPVFLLRFKYLIRNPQSVICDACIPSARDF